MAILAFDTGWNGMGWALAHPDGVIDCGHVGLGSRSWRWQALREWLDSDFADLVTELVARSEGPHPRVVVEVPPKVYQRGNQASTGHGLGQLSGPICLASYQDRLGYPWELTPADWRAWWGISGRGRAAKKRMAITVCRNLKFGRLVDRFPETDEDFAPRSDVAEACLLAVGAARHAKDAPKGPRHLAARELPGLPLPPRRGPPT